MTLMFSVKKEIYSCALEKINKARKKRKVNVVTFTIMLKQNGANRIYWIKINKTIIINDRGVVKYMRW